MDHCYSNTFALWHTSKSKEIAEASKSVHTLQLIKLKLLLNTHRLLIKERMRGRRGEGMRLNKPRKTKKWPKNWPNIDRGYYQAVIYLFKISKSTMETVEQCVRSIQVNNKNTTTCLHCWLRTRLPAG